MSEERLDEVLFGAERAEQIVAVETGDRKATLFVREGEATVRRRLHENGERQDGF